MPRAKLVLFPSAPTILSIVVALVTLFADTRNADASCGDYLLVNGVPVSHQPMTNPGESVFDQDSGSQRPVERTCNGPNCSSSPTVPSPVASTVQSTERTELPATVGVKALATLEFTLAEHSSESIVAIAEIDGIYRPPQAFRG